MIPGIIFVMMGAFLLTYGACLVHFDVQAKKHVHDEVFWYQTPEFKAWQKAQEKYGPQGAAQFADLHRGR